MKSFFLHDSLVIRFISMLGLAGLILTVSWLLSYHLLPEGILRGRTAAAVLAGDEAAASFPAEFARIFLLNLFMLTAIVLASRLIEVGGFPLGYLPPLLLSGIYAIVLGTNSFSIPLPRPIAPSLVIFSRSGIYEIAAYVLAAVSTPGIQTHRFKRLVPPDSEPILPRPSFLKNVSPPGMLLAIVMLLLANAYEASRIMLISAGGS